MLWPERKGSALRGASFVYAALSAEREPLAFFFKVEKPFPTGSFAFASEIKFRLTRPFRSRSPEVLFQSHHVSFGQENELTIVPIGGATLPTVRLTLKFQGHLHMNEKTIGHVAFTSTFCFFLLFSEPENPGPNPNNNGFAFSKWLPAVEAGPELFGQLRTLESFPLENVNSFFRSIGTEGFLQPFSKKRGRPGISLGFSSSHYR